MGYEYKKNAAGEFVCPHCGTTKRLQSTMHYHMKKHEGKLPFECKLCKKSFLHASTLELHMKAQHQAEKERMYKCPMPDCPYEGTLTKANLLIHYVRKHCKEEAAALVTGEKGKPTCKGCSKTCNSMTAFHYHVVGAGCMALTDARKAHVETIQS